MKKLTFYFVLCCFQCLSAQTLESFYQDKNYEEVVKFEKDSSTLTAEQLYRVGYSYFILENDKSALQMFDQAIGRGLQSADIHFFRGLTLKYLKRLPAALEALQQAARLEPDNQEFASEVGRCYYDMDQTDNALEAYKKAQKLPNTDQSPFYMVGHIYNLKDDYAQALREFHIGIDSISIDNKYYLKALMDIGRLEYKVTKDYKKSADSYIKALALVPTNYTIHPKLMKALNAAGEYGKADSIFAIMKDAYQKEELPEADMKYASAPIDEFEWKGQWITVYKNFAEPENTLDVIYKAYLLTKDNATVERTFLTEQTISLGLPDSPKHLFCEQGKDGAHFTYPYGWKDDNIPLKSFKEIVVAVLDEEVTPQASSKKGKN